MSNSIVSHSALNASGTIGDAPIHFGICIIQPDGSYEPPISISAAAQRDPVAFQAFADKISHEAELPKSYKSIIAVGLSHNATEQPTIGG